MSNLRNEDSDLLYSNNTGNTIASLVESKLGCPYEWGAAGPNSFDCSGLAYWAHQQVGISIPRVSSDQGASGTPISVGDLQPGDLMFYDTAGSGSITHTTIYVGGTSMIHAPKPGDVVKYTDMNYDYWTTKFKGARRYW